MYEAFAIQFLGWFSNDERLSTSLNREGIVSIPNPWRQRRINLQFPTIWKKVIGLSWEVEWTAALLLTSSSKISLQLFQAPQSISTSKWSFKNRKKKLFCSSAWLWCIIVLCKRVAWTYGVDEVKSSFVLKKEKWHVWYALKRPACISEIKEIIVFFG